MKKLKYIDALRGIAAMSVLVIHCYNEIEKNLPGWIQNSLMNGARGVQLFYIISAFTIFLSYSRRDQFEKHVDLNFFIRRFFRIAPMYYVAIVYYLIQNGKEISDLRWPILSNLLFLHGLYPSWITSVVPVGWSVSVEVFFYCMIPFLFKKLKNINYVIAFFIVSLVFSTFLSKYILASEILKENMDAEWFVLFYFPYHLPVFACGIFLFFLIYEPRQELKINPLLLFLLSMVLLGDLATEKRLIFSLFTNHILFSVAFVLLTYALSKREFTLLVNPFTRYLGKISYSLYLVHMGVLHWMERLNISMITPQNSKDAPVIDFVLRFVILSALSILVATLCYHVVEVPFQKLGKRLIARHEGKKNAVVGQLSMAK